MTERRYDEEEVRRIFDDAARASAESARGGPADEGLSLEELKRIGGEVGLPPARIEAAARALDVADLQPDVVRDFGLPVTVGRTVALGRAPTDDEWAQLVGLARRTFNAKGQVDPTGRYWYNGNLSMSVEPSVDGHRLVFRTTKGDARLLTRFGAGMVGLGSLLALGSIFVSEPAAAVAASGIGGYGALALAINALRLPRWANRRTEQMELLASRAVDLLAAGAPDP